MLGGRLLQGLAFSTLGCFVAPIVKPSLFYGANNGDFGVTRASHENESNLELNGPKRDTFLKLLIAGKSSEEGLVVELNRGEEESSQWQLSKVSWRGGDWNRKWILYYDNVRQEHSFIDDFRRERGCYGYTVYWGSNKACLVNGRVSQKDEEAWKNRFPKIKFDGWSSRLWGYGYSPQAILSSMDNCSVRMGERNINGSPNLIAAISCGSGALIKKISTSDFGEMLIEKR